MLPLCSSPESSSLELFKSGPPVYKSNVDIEFCTIEFHHISTTSVFKVILFILCNNLIMYWQCKWKAQKEIVATEEVCTETSFRLSRLVFPGCICSQEKEKSLSGSQAGARTSLPGMNRAWWISSVVCHRKISEKLFYWNSVFVNTVNVSLTHFLHPYAHTVCFLVVLQILNRINIHTPPHTSGDSAAPFCSPYALFLSPVL